MSFDPVGDSFCSDAYCPIEFASSFAAKRECRGPWLQRMILPHEPWLRQVLRCKYPAIDLDEVLQATYLRLMAAGQVGHVKNGKSYLYRAAISEIVDQARRTQIVQFEAIDLRAAEWASDEPVIESVIDSKRALAQFHKAMCELPPRQQTVIELRRIEGLPVRETAERLAISVSNVEKLQVQAMRRLHAAMAQL